MNDTPSILQIATTTGPVSVPAWRVAAGLAITLGASEGRPTAVFTVTHVASGRCLGPPTASYLRAVDYLGQFSAVGNWERSSAELVADEAFVAAAKKLNSTLWRLDVERLPVDPRCREGAL